MSRTLLLADEISVPGATGTATSFTQATVVRLVNNNTSAAVVTVVETQGGNGIGSFTMPGNSVEFLEKTASHCVFAVGGAVFGAKVGFTG
jgi:hypothetical protein